MSDTPILYTLKTTHITCPNCGYSIGISHKKRGPAKKPPKPMPPYAQMVTQYKLWYDSFVVKEVDGSLPTIPMKTLYEHFKTHVSEPHYSYPQFIEAIHMKHFVSRGHRFSLHVHYLILKDPNAPTP